VTGELPVYITENGSAWHDYVTAGGQVHDEERIAYLRGHLAALHAAIGDGVPLKGYFAWSLIDNFEWAEGYAKRFGLAFVDFETPAADPQAQRRVLRGGHRGERAARGLTARRRTVSRPVRCPAGCPPAGHRAG